MLAVLKKLALVGGITAIGHSLSLVLFPIANRLMTPEDVSLVGVYDSALVLVLSIIGFGVNATATRDIALSSDWQRVLTKVQQARLSVSLLSAAIGMVAYSFGGISFPLALVFLVSPAFAMHFDFALYGRGKPEAAALISLLRQALPIGVFIVLMFLGWHDANTYMLLLVVFVLLAAWLTSRVLSVSFVYTPSLSGWRVYKASAGIGVAGIGLAFQRYGFLPTLQGEFATLEFVFLLTSLKVLLLVVAFKRLLIQTFYQKLDYGNTALLLNGLCLAVGAGAVLMCHVFSSTIAQWLFDDIAGSHFVIAIGWGTMSLMMFSVSDARLLLQHKDKWMYSVTIASSIAFVLSMYVGKYLGWGGLNFLYSLVAIEALLACMYKLGLFLDIGKVKE